LYVVFRANICHDNASYHEVMFVLSQEVVIEVIECVQSIVQWERIEFCTDSEKAIYTLTAVTRDPRNEKGFML